MPNGAVTAIVWVCVTVIILFVLAKVLVPLVAGA